jgi:hypothetical protein
VRVGWWSLGVLWTAAAGCAADEAPLGDTGVAFAEDRSQVAGSRAAFHAWGRYDGDPFDVECFLDGSDPEATGGLRCQDDVHFSVWCGLDPGEAPVAGLERFQVWFSVHAAIVSPGTHDTTGGASVTLGEAIGWPLSCSAANVTDCSVSVDAANPWSTASGSFKGAWSGEDPVAGDHTATIQGTFDFECE